MVIHYYNYNKSDVCILMLDPRKALGRVRHCILFNKLLNRDISPIGLRMLIHNVHKSSLECSVVPATK